MGGKLVIDSPRGVGVHWKGDAVVDGQRWPLSDGDTVWLPAGAHAVEADATEGSRLRVSHFNGAVRSARMDGNGRIEISYQSQSRAIAMLSSVPGRVEVDGADQVLRLAGPRTLLLPRGQHVVTITAK